MILLLLTFCNIIIIESAFYCSNHNSFHKVLLKKGIDYYHMITSY